MLVAGRIPKQIGLGSLSHAECAYSLRMRLSEGSARTHADVLSWCEDSVVSQWSTFFFYR